MSPEALQIALGAPEAWETLTPPQAEAVNAVVQHATIAATARALGISRQAVLDRLRHAAKKLEAFAEAISRPPA